MDRDGHDDEFFAAPIQFVVVDSTLSLAELEPFAVEYSVRFGSDVSITCRWGGPAAGGPGWGGPEIAVMIIAGEVLRRTASDAYGVLKQFIIDKYLKIRTRTGARWYVDGALALGIDSESQTTRVLFCLPEGMSPSELDRSLKLVEQHEMKVLAKWEDQGRAEVKVCWSEETQEWVECQPMPDDIEVPPPAST